MFNRKEYMKEYYIKNQIKISKYQKKYSTKNQIKISKYQKKYRAENRAKISKQRKKYDAENADKISKYQKKWRAENKDKIREFNKKWREENRDEISEINKKYRAKNADKIKKQKKKYNAKNRVKIREHLRKRRKTDELYKAKCSLRSRMYKVFKAKGFIKDKKTLEILGCTDKEFKKHLESLFKPGMTWENYGFGSNKWNIDHIIPLALGKTVEDLYRLCHYTNLQPLWQTDNFKKGARY